MPVLSPAPMTRSFQFRDLLIAFVLLLASVQCVRSIYGSSISFIDWRAYAAGQAPMPYQGRIGMMPWLRWAESSPWMLRLCRRYQTISEVGNKLAEPMTVEKFASMLASLAALLLMVAAAGWYSLRCGYRPWWLLPALVLLIVMLTLALRTEANYWYVYDLPHAALFGLASLCILEGWWAPLLPLFALDTLVRETSVYLIVLAAAGLAAEQTRARRRLGAAAILLMAAGWAAMRLAIQHRFAHNPSELGPRLGLNLHTLLLPHHWPQLFSAGGYLVLFVWLERRRLPRRQQLFLWAALLCAPLTLYFGIWVETRIWLEWTLPLAVLAAAEWSGSQHASVNAQGTQ